MKKSICILLYILLIILLSGCAAGYDNSITAADSPIPSASASPAEEASTTAEPTPKPSIAPEHTAQPAPQSTPGTIDFTKPDWLELGENAVMLTDEEINRFNTEFFNGGMMNIHNQFLASLYDRPENINLYELFYNGTGPRTEEEMPKIRGKDISAYIAKYGFWSTETPTDKLPVAKINEVLLENTGLGLEETDRIGLRFNYVPESDAYFHAHGDTNYMFYNILYGYKEGNSEFLFYSDSKLIWDTEKQDYGFLSGVFRAELYNNGAGYHFKSNMRVEQSGSEVTYKAYMRFPETAEYINDREAEKIELIADATLSADSFEKALENIEAQGGERIFYEEIPADCWPDYGELVSFKLTGTPHGSQTQLFFVYRDGRVCRLPLPAKDYIGMPVTYGYENNMFYFQGWGKEYLCYCAVFDDELVNDESGVVIHKAGRHYYFFIPETGDCYLTIVE